MPKIKDKSALIISILIPIAVGALSALFSNNMSSYATLIKPPLSPPSFIFPIVWTILFILMGISSYIIYKSKDSSRNKALFTTASVNNIQYPYPQKSNNGAEKSGVFL